MTSRILILPAALILGAFLAACSGSAPERARPVSGGTLPPPPGASAPSTQPVTGSAPALAAPADSAMAGMSMGGGSCDPSAAQPLIGEAATPDVLNRAQGLAGAASQRTIGPNDVVTMEFVETRLTVDLNDSGRIMGFRCG